MHLDASDDAAEPIELTKDWKFTTGSSTSGGLPGFVTAMVVSNDAILIGGTLVISWNNPSDGNFAGTRLVRRTGSYPAAYTDGEQVYNGTSEAFTDTGLLDGTNYYYAAFAYNEASFHIDTNDSMKDSAAPQDLAPPGDVTALYVDNITISTGGTLVITWTDPADADFAGTRLIRKTGSYPADHSDGSIVYSGIAEAYIDTGLIDGTMNYYTAFAYDAVSNFIVTSASARGAAASLDVGDPIVPRLSYISLPSNSTQISRYAHIRVHITDKIQVAFGSICIKIGLSYAYSNGSFYEQFDGAASLISANSTNGYNIVVDKSSPFATNELINVSVYAEDTSTNSLSAAWSFTTTNDVPPVFSTSNVTTVYYLAGDPLHGLELYTALTSYHVTMQVITNIFALEELDPEDSLVYIPGGLYSDENDSSGIQENTGVLDTFLESGGFAAAFGLEPPVDDPWDNEWSLFRDYVLTNESVSNTNFTKTSKEFTGLHPVLTRLSPCPMPGGYPYVIPLLAPEWPSTIRCSRMWRITRS